MSEQTLNLEVAPDYAPLREPLLALLDNFDTQGDTLHRKRNTVKKMSLDGTDVVVKSFQALGGLRAFIYGRVRKSKARRSYEYAQRLRHMGVGTPDPVAFCEQHRGNLLKNSFFVSQFYAHDFSMSHALPAPDQGAPPAEATAIIEAFVEFTFKLHEDGVLHIDHNPSNTLVRRRAGGFDFAIIDINRMQFGPLGLRQRMSNLVRLTDDLEVMQLMARTYAALAREKPQRCEELLMKLKRRHWRKLASKKRLKRLVRKAP